MNSSNPDLPQHDVGQARPLARLIAATQPLDATLSTDGFVAYVARVSNPSNQHNAETAPRLLRYLRRHKHWSPFEMAHAVLEINTTRDIARQILRHRSFSFQEFSQRYSSEIEFAGPREARLQDHANRQNSIELEADDDYARSIERWVHLQAAVKQAAGLAYAEALRLGIAKEVARAVLPEGLTMSRLYMAGSLRSWLHYIELRTGPETQKEHRLVAEACRVELAAAFPAIFEANE